MLSSFLSESDNIFIIFEYFAAYTMSSSNCCMICHDEVDKSGNYPVRNCSCRGTSGHVHFECLVEGLRKKDKFDLFDWTNCSLCKQGYYDTFEVDLILTCQDHVIQKFGTESKHYLLVQIRMLQMTYFEVSEVKLVASTGSNSIC